MVAAQLVSWVVHHSASPVPESGRGAFQDLEGGDAFGAADGGQDAAPGGDAAFLFGGVEEHEDGVDDLAHHRQGLLVGSWIISAPVVGSSYSRSRAWSPGRARVPAGRGVTMRRR